MTHLIWILRYFVRRRYNNVQTIMQNEVVYEFFVQRPKYYKSFTETHQFHMTIVYQSNFKSGLDHCLKYQVINVFVLEGIGFHCASCFYQNGPQSNVPHLANGHKYFSDLKL